MNNTLNWIFAKKWMNKPLNQYLSFYSKWIKNFEWINKIFIVRKFDRNQIFKLKGKTIVTKTGYLESRNRDPESTRFFMKHGPKGDPNPKLRLSRWRTVSLRLKLGTKNWGLRWYLFFSWNIDQTGAPNQIKDLVTEWDLTYSNHAIPFEIQIT